MRRFGTVRVAPHQVDIPDYKDDQLWPAHVFLGRVEVSLHSREVELEIPFSFVDPADHRLGVTVVALRDQGHVDAATAGAANQLHRVSNVTPVLQRPERNVILYGQRIRRLDQLDPGAVVLCVGQRPFDNLDFHWHVHRLLVVGTDVQLAGVGARGRGLWHVDRHPHRHHGAEDWFRLIGRRQVVPTWHLAADRVLRRWLLG